MSTDYNLDIATSLNPVEMRKRLCDELSGSTFGENLLGADGLVISVKAIGDYRREVPDETYTCTPTADIQFTVDRAHPDNAVRTMLRGAFALFATAGTSGVLLANGGTVVPLSAGLCAMCGGGSIEFVNSEPSGIIVLLCDVCFSMRLDPADLGTGRAFSANDAAIVIPGTRSTMQRSHDATMGELEARGWRKYVTT